MIQAIKKLISGNSNPNWKLVKAENFGMEWEITLKKQGEKATFVGQACSWMKKPKEEFGDYEQVDDNDLINTLNAIWAEKIGI